MQGYLREVRDEKVYAIDWKDKLDVLKNTYYLKVNETEMETITGLKDPKEAAKLIHAWGVAEVIITLGSEGSLVYVDDTFYDIPAYPPHEVVDATGCGDTYSAGYLYKRLQGANPVEAGKFAAAMCTIKLEHNGPFNRTIEDVMKSSDNRRGNPHFEEKGSFLHAGNCLLALSLPSVYPLKYVV